MADRRDYFKEDYECYKKLGVCVACRRENAEPNKTLCFECNERQKQRTNNRRASMTAEEKAKKIQKNKIQYAERKSQGLCVRCGKRKATENYSNCVECRIKDNRRKSRYIPKSPVPIDMRNALGLCRQCGEPLAHPDNTLCLACHGKRSEATKKMHENPTPAMQKAKEAYKQNQKEFRDKLFYAPQIQKQENALAIENFKRMVASC